MKILYIAGAINLSDRSGGATHVREVAEELAARGHSLHVVARASNPAEIANWGWQVDDQASHSQSAAPRQNSIAFYQAALPDKIALFAFPAITNLARQIGADVVMERYYNFAGAGAVTARQLHLPLVLEVNAPMVDPPGSLKSKVDRLLLHSMGRWALTQARQAQRIVTPLNTTVPHSIPRSKIVELPWGANVGRFDPNIRAQRPTELARLRGKMGIPVDATVAVFVGSFRAWHGVQLFAAAAAELAQTQPDLYFLAVGGGPELHKVKAALKGRAANIVFTGPQKHERIPAILALSDIGVAPFVPDVYAPLRHFGFYWSPLKVFEYMASALPVVTIDIAPLNQIVRDNQEGLLYPPSDTSRLTAAIATLAQDKDLRDNLGAAARERVVAQFSWAKHAEHLERTLQEAIKEKS